MKKLLSILLLLFIPTSCFAWSLFEPKNIEDCILENMKGVSSDTAAQMIYKMCAEKFKDKEVVNNPKYKWTRHHNSETAVFYIDYSTITKHGKIVTVTGMIDYHKVQIGKYDVQYSSMISLLE
ncbi:MAG: surface-adhesin E family protein [Methylococcaceae bacterium]